MARLGLKLYYLRTRERSLSQQQVAQAIGTGQPTLSHIEQGASMPSCSLLLDLCRFFDVSPTFLLDDERDVQPLPTERWSIRNALVTTGMWIECNEATVARTRDGKLLAPLMPGESFYDPEAAVVRRDAASRDEALRRLDQLGRERRDIECDVIDTLERELIAHPRQRPAVRRSGS